MLKPSQAAKEVGLSRARIQQAITDGQLPAKKMFGERWAIRRSDLIAWKNNPDYHRMGQPKKKKS